MNLIDSKRCVPKSIKFAEKGDAYASGTYSAYVLVCADASVYLYPSSKCNYGSAE